MPEEIIRSYLADPFLYNDYTFCTGCGNYPHQSEFHWADTGENLHAYNRRLRIEYIQRNNLNPNDFVWKNGAPERRKRKLGGIILAGGCLAVLVVAVGLIGVVAAGAAALFRPASGPAPGFVSPPAPTFGADPGFAGSPLGGGSAFPDPAAQARQRMEEARREIEQRQQDLRRQHEEFLRQHEEMHQRLRDSQ
jgi:hypothetical protein